MNKCPMCGFPVESDSHVYNIHCALSNAENDQLEAEVEEIRKMNLDVEVPESAIEAMREMLAYMRFVRLVASEP